MIDNGRDSNILATASQCRQDNDCRAIFSQFHFERTSLQTNRSQVNLCFSNGLDDKKIGDNAGSKLSQFTGARLYRKSKTDFDYNNHNFYVI